VVGSPSDVALPELPGIVGLEVIGRGGFATVYRGEQASLHRTVAVKILNGASGQMAWSRFRTEIRALGSLSGHPHVVAVYDAGEYQGHPYMVMPFLTGGSLGDRMGQGALPAGEVVHMGVAVADALDAAHRVGLLHRDIKPANVLITASGDAQLADFGIARFADATLTNGPLTATIGYAAPEVLAGQPATVASDIYSLGATLYAAAAGAAPFQMQAGETPIAFAMRVIEREPPDPAEAGVRGPLARIIATAMAKQPVDRYPSAAAVKEALQALQRSGELAGPAVPIQPSPPLRRRRRTPRILAGTAVAAALLAGGLGVTLVATRAPARHRTSATAPAAGHPISSASPVTAPPASTPPPPTSSIPPSTSSTPPSTSSTPPSTAGASTSSQPLPPLAGDFSPATLTQTVDQYYAIVNRHDLSQSFAWLSPAFQQRIGWAYYQSFWGAIQRVNVVSVTPGRDSATLILQYVGGNGAVSTEQDRVTFTSNAQTGRILIDSYSFLS
jgi:serine/threonine protein kinase